jgi:hypothetical protein
MRTDTTHQLGHAIHYFRAFAGSRDTEPCPTVARYVFDKYLEDETGHWIEITGKCLTSHS